MGLTFILFKFNFKTFNVGLTFKYLNFNYFYNFSSCHFSNATIIIIFFLSLRENNPRFPHTLFIFFNNKGLMKI